MTFGNLVGGEWRSNEEVTENDNLSDTSDVVGVFARVSPEDARGGRRGTCGPPAWSALRVSTARMVIVNLATAGVNLHVPFGVRDASYGPREQGDAARKLFAIVRTSYLAAGEVRRSRPGAESSGKHVVTARRGSYFAPVVEVARDRGSRSPHLSSATAAKKRCASSLKSTGSSRFVT